MSRSFAKQTAEPGVLYERARGICLDWGTLAELPAAGAVGYMPGALYDAADQAAGANIYINNGTFSSALFQSAGLGGNETIAANTIWTIAANTGPGDLVITDGTTTMFSIDTRTTASGGGGTTFTGQPVSLASAGSALLASTISVAAKTVTLTGTTTTTSLLGCQLYLAAVTATDSSACTLTTLSNMHIVANAAAGGSLTITNSYMISTSVAGCFLTNAGTWTSSSTQAHKEEISDSQDEDVFGILDKIQARSYTWRDSFVNDHGRTRFGLIAEELPESLWPPGHNEGAPLGLPDGIVAAFAVVAAKHLLQDNRRLKKHVDDLEKRIAHIEATLEKFKD
jgi:hypothetical protein